MLAGDALAALVSAMISALRSVASAMTGARGNWHDVGDWSTCGCRVTERMIRFGDLRTLLGTACGSRRHPPVLQFLGWNEPLANGLLWTTLCSGDDRYGAPAPNLQSAPPPDICRISPGSMVHIRCERPSTIVPAAPSGGTPTSPIIANNS
jgi:hypothetical protein